MPGCDAPLYIIWQLARPVFIDDTVEDLRKPEDAYAADWKISCEEGHIVLLPLTGGDDYERFGDNDSNDEVPPEQKDLARLHSLLKGVPNA